MSSVSRLGAVLLLGLALVVAAMPVGANGATGPGCINITTSFNGEGLFVWYGLGEAVGFVVGASDQGAGATVGVLVFPDLCSTQRAVESLVMGTASSAPAPDEPRAPVLP